MTFCSTDEGWDTTLVLAVLQIDDWCVVSEWRLVSILPVPVDLHEMTWAGLLSGDLNPKDLLRIFLLMWVSKNLNLS